MIARFEKFTTAISEIHRCLLKITSDVMTSYDLKGPYAVYLISLNQYDEGLTSVQLSELCSRNKADVSRAVATLEEAGLVHRVSTCKNHYRAIIKLTEAGKTAANAITEKAEKAVTMAGAGLSEEKREIFYEVISIISQNMHRMSKEGLTEMEE